MKLINKVVGTIYMKPGANLIKNSEQTLLKKLGVEYKVLYSGIGKTFRLYVASHAISLIQSECVITEKNSQSIMTFI